MKIQVRIQYSYGKEFIYPICEQAKVLASLVNQKTFTREDIKKIKELGYRIEIVNEVRDL